VFRSTARDRSWVHRLQWVHISTARQSGVCSRVSRRQSYSRIRVTSNGNSCNHLPIKLTLANPIQRVTPYLCVAKGEPAISGAQQIGATRELKASEQNRSRGWGQSFGLPRTMCAITCFIRASEHASLPSSELRRLRLPFIHCRSASLSSSSSSSSSSHFVSFSLSIPKDIYPPPRITNETRDKENQPIRIRKEPVISSQSSSSSLNIRMNGLAHPPNPLPRKRKRRKLDTV
jgi:hypothetical protein